MCDNLLTSSRDLNRVRAMEMVDATGITPLRGRRRLGCCLVLMAVTSMLSAHRAIGTLRLFGSMPDQPFASLGRMTRDVRSGLLEVPKSIEPLVHKYLVGYHPIA